MEGCLEVARFLCMKSLLIDMRRRVGTLPDCGLWLSKQNDDGRPMDGTSLAALRHLDGDW